MTDSVPYRKKLPVINGSDHRLLQVLPEDADDWIEHFNRYTYLRAERVPWVASRKSKRDYVIIAISYRPSEGGRGNAELAKKIIAIVDGDLPTVTFLMRRRRKPTTRTKSIRRT